MSKEAMKLAQDWYDSGNENPDDFADMIKKVITLAQQPAQPQQEPYEIDWPDYHEQAMGCGLEDRDEHCRYGAMRYGWDCAIEAVAQALPDAIYTSPPAQRTWFGLTDEEIDETHETKVWDARRSYARAIEAKLKEKNNG